MLNTKEISEQLGVSEETVRRWIRTGELEAVQEGKSYYVDEEVLQIFTEKKIATPGTSLSKMNNLNNLINFGAGLMANPKAREIATELLNKNKGKFLKAASPKQDKEVTVSDLQDYIAALERKKKKLELEYEIELLEIEDEIANYKKLIKEKQ